MSDDKILKFKILTDGDRNGEPMYLRANDIRRIASIEVKSHSTYIVGQSKMIQGSVLFMKTDSGMPTQSVQETPEEVAAAMGLPLVVVEDIELRQDNINKNLGKKTKALA